MERLTVLLQVINAIQDGMGRLFSFLLIPLMFVTTIEVVSRYIFNSPTIWAWDVNIQLFGAIILIGGGYAYLHEMHVRVDLLIVNLSPRAKALLNLFTSFLFFFSYSVLLWQGCLIAWDSLKTKEHYTSIWAPPIYPLKMLIPLAVFIFLLQGAVKFTCDLLTVIDPKRGEKK